MLTQKDKKLIEKYLDFNQTKDPNAEELSAKEKNIWDKRIQDPDFQRHLKLSEDVNSSIQDEDTIQFRRTLQKITNKKHNL